MNNREGRAREKERSTENKCYIQRLISLSAAERIFSLGIDQILQQVRLFPPFLIVNHRSYICDSSVEYTNGGESQTNGKSMYY